MAAMSPALPKIDWRAFADAMKDTIEHPEENIGRWLLVIVMLLFLWLLRRVDDKKQGDLKRSATDVLEEKYNKGEISEESYRKTRAELSLRQKK
jgi:hypothetical protein